VEKTVERLRKPEGGTKREMDLSQVVDTVGNAAKRAENSKQVGPQLSVGAGG
jgi:hypothetical protein